MAKATAKKRSSATSSSKSKSSSGTKSSNARKSQTSPTSRAGSSRSTKSPTAGSGNRSRSSRSQSGSLLEKFFHDELKDLYSAEKQLLRGLAKMSKNATTAELKEAFDTHRTQTEGQIERLEHVFELLGARPQAKKCEAMAGLIEEVESVLEDTKDDTMTRDVALIMGAQKAEHYEIASYGGLAQLARTMGRDEIADLLEETLEEEKETDLLLTQIAENHINLEAEEEGESDDEDDDDSEADDDDESEEEEADDEEEEK